MIYLDTSIAIPIFLREAASSEILDWLDTPKKDLIAADWIVTEFASALFVKARRGDVAQESARSAWESFDRFCRSGLRLIPVTRTALPEARTSSAKPKAPCVPATPCIWRWPSRSASRKSPPPTNNSNKAPPPTASPSPVSNSKFVMLPGRSSAGQNYAE